MICEKCERALEVGDWPFCPHGRGLGMLGEFKPYWEDRCTPEPVYVTSLAQKQRLFKSGDGTRTHRVEEVEHRLTPSQAIERMHARRERTIEQMRQRGDID